MRQAKDRRIFRLTGFQKSAHQKRRFFPHLDEEFVNGPVTKKHRGTQTLTVSHQEEFSEMRTVLDVLTELEKEVPEIKTATYQRLDWLKRASLLPGETLDELPKGDNDFHSSRDMRSGSGGALVADQIAVLELLIPSVFRAVIALHPTGSIVPDAVAFFSPDEGGSYVHARRISTFNVFRNITNMLPWLHSILLVSMPRQHCLIYCTGSAAIILYSQKSAVNAGSYCQWTKNQLCFYLRFNAHTETFLSVNICHRIPQLRIRASMIPQLIILVVFLKKHFSLDAAIW